MTDTSLSTQKPSDFERFISLSNFELAWQRVRGSQRYEVKDRLALRTYSANLENHLRILIDQLTPTQNNLVYTPTSPKFIYKPRNDGLLRPFAWLNFADRLIYQAIANIVLQNARADLLKYANNPIFAYLPDGELSIWPFRPPFSLKTKKGKQVTGQYNLFQRQITSYAKRASQHSDAWFIEADIAGYYPSVEHDLLIQLLKKRGWLTDTSLLGLLQACLFTWQMGDPDGQPILGRGLPVGYEASDLLATLFLLPIDEFISQELRSTGVQIKYARFVDDLCLFVTGNSNAQKVNRLLDLALHRRGLIRNAKKSTIKLVSPTLAGDIEDKRKNRQRWSQLDFLLDGPSEEEAIAQGELSADLTEMAEEIRVASAEAKEQILVKLAGAIAFTIGRLTIQDDDALFLAIELLNNCPKHSYSASLYLSRYITDPQIYALLLKQAGTSPYTSVRIDCMETLVNTELGITSKIKSILYEWLKIKLDDHDQRLVQRACEWLAQTDDGWKHIFDNFCNSENYHVAATAISECFDKANDQDSQIELINKAITYYSPVDTTGSAQDYLQLVGVYLWRRATFLPQNRLHLSKIHSKYEQLKLDPQDFDSTKVIRRQLEALFKTKVSSELPLSNIFGDLVGAAQLLVDLGDATTDPDLTTEKLAELLCLIGAYLETNQPADKALDWQDFLNNLEQDPFDALIDIRSAKQALDSGKRVKIQHELLVANTAKAFTALFDIIHKDLGLKMDHGYRADQEQTMNETFDVFLCHNSKDKEEVLELHRKLCEANLNPWIDAIDIRPGLNWQPQVQAGLEKCKSTLVFISQSGFGPWQLEELQKALDLATKRTEYPVIPLIWKDVPEGQEPTLLFGLDNKSWVDYRRTHPDPWSQLLFGITGKKLR